MRRTGTDKPLELAAMSTEMAAFRLKEAAQNIHALAKDAGVASEAELVALRDALTAQAHQARRFAKSLDWRVEGLISSLNTAIIESGVEDG